MQILLDTHVVLWALAGDPALPAKARALIKDDRNEPMKLLTHDSLVARYHPDILLV